MTPMPPPQALGGPQAGPPQGPPQGGPPQPPPGPSPQQIADMQKQQAAQQEIYGIDPLVLQKPVKIRIDGSSRMVSKDVLMQMVPFLAQFMFNGPFVSQLAQLGETPDYETFFKMLQDASGTTRMYPLLKPLTPEQQQRLSTPPPEVMAKAQQADKEQQTRLQIMQMKLQGDQQTTEINARLKELQIQEESARHLIDVMQEEKSGLQAMLDEAQSRQQDLQGKQQDQALKNQGAQQALAAKQAQAQHALGLAKTNALQDLLHSHVSNQQDLQQADAVHQQNMSQAQMEGLAKVRSLLAQGQAKAAAARMQPNTKGPGRGEPSE